MENLDIPQLANIGFAGAASIFLAKLLWNDMSHLNINMEKIMEKLDRIVDALERKPD